MDTELLFQRNYDYMSRRFFQHDGMYQFERHSKEELEARLRAYFGTEYAILTTSATMAKVTVMALLSPFGTMRSPSVFVPDPHSSSPESEPLPLRGPPSG